MNTVIALKKSKDYTDKRVEENGGEPNKIDKIKVNSTDLPILEDKSVNIIVPVKLSDLTNDIEYQTATDISRILEDYALLEESGCDLGLSIDSSTYVMTLELKNKLGKILTSKQVDLPLESSVVGMEQNKEAGTITLVLRNGIKTEPISISSLIKGFIQDTFTIAGLNMKDDITKEELAGALGLTAITSTELEDILV